MSVFLGEPVKGDKASEIYSGLPKLDVNVLSEFDEDEVFVRHYEQPILDQRGFHSGDSITQNRGLDDDVKCLLLAPPDFGDENAEYNHDADFMFRRSFSNKLRLHCKRSRRSLCTCILLLTFVAALIISFIFILKNSGKSHGVSMLDSDTRATERKVTSESSSIHGCDSVRVDDVWSVGFAKLTTSSAMRLVDSNQDGVLDVVFGYGTGVDDSDSNSLLCSIYFGGVANCFGGVRCLDGRDGRILWDAPTKHEVHSLNCAADLDFDGVQDCVAGGRGSLLVAISGLNGMRLWQFGPTEGTKETTFEPGVEHEGDEKDPLILSSNMYTAALIGDVDDDGVVDIAQVHGGNREKVSVAAALLVVSGRTGKLLRSVSMPNSEEASSSPELLVLDDGLPALVYGTGSETRGGSLWRVKLADLLDGRAEERSIRMLTRSKGWLAPCALVDLTSDNIVDLVCASFNSSVCAIDGRTWRTLWTFTQPSGATLATPAVGYFNDDDVPDLAVQFNVGDGFPLYYYAVTWLLDGRTGLPLNSTPGASSAFPVYSLLDTQNSPLTVSLDGHGNDLLLFWTATCSDSQDRRLDSLEDAVFVGSRANESEMRRRYVDDRQMLLTGDAKPNLDFCEQRFDSSYKSRSIAFLADASRDRRTVVYDEATRANVEHGENVDTEAELRDWLQRNPQYRAYYDQYAAQVRQLQQLEGASQTNPRREVQRVLSTGTLAPSLAGSSNASECESAIDYVFATYWSPASVGTLLYADEKRCVDELLLHEENLRAETPFRDMDHNRFVQVVIKRCLRQSKHGADRADKLQIDASNPFQLDAGQLTVYRVRLTCMSHNRQCARILPYEQQRWAAYLGTHGDGRFRFSPIP